MALALSVSLPTLARGYFNDQAPLTVPHPTSFAECRQFFPEGRPPVVPKRPALRELCYEAFAVLHSGETKTPVYVAQRLNRKSIEDADERRADKFFADARLPVAERAELEDYKRSG
ncbi:MAG: DNA/RNA non-specific endonuclease, partial [Brachymonas sp.]|nr:DNA/RNA non-specific endonuclease [Brachymonas sp.]